MPFTVYMDNQLLETFKTNMNLSKQQIRWLEQLQSFQFDVIHVPRKLNSGADALLRRPDHRQIKKTEALSKWLPNVTNIIGPEATCITITQLGTIDLTMKKLQNDSIAVDRQLVKNNRSEHELLSLIPNITDVKVSSIVTDVTPASVVLTLTNIA